MDVRSFWRAYRRLNKRRNAWVLGANRRAGTLRKTPVRIVSFCAASRDFHLHGLRRTCSPVNSPVL